MPRARARAAVADTAKVAEPIMPVELEEKVELDGFEEMEEEVEYEEVEEEEELEEEEEVLEEVEEEVEEEEEEAEKESGNIIDTGTGLKDDATLSGNYPMKEGSEGLDDEGKKHTELLELPPHGSEVYVGGIPPDATEEELRIFCESSGEVTEVRMMKGKESSENKGYAFVTFRTRELAASAIEKLNNTEFKGKKIKCSSSQAKNRLFLGNVPRKWTEDDLKKAVLEIGPGVTSVDLMKDPQNSSRNRGFAFIEFYNHACAAYAKQKMSDPKFKLDSNGPTISWADPKTGDSSSQIKSVYVKNLPKDISQDQLRKLFEHHGEIAKIVLPPAKSGQERRFGFVHFSERSSAMKALKNTERYEIDGEVIECSLAKPPVEKKAESRSSGLKGNHLPNYASARVGYGIMGGGLAPGFAPAMIYGGRQAGVGGTAMVPMVLPDGRIAYVVQPQAGVSLTRGGGDGSSSSNRSGGNRKGKDTNQKRRYNPY